MDLYELPFAKISLLREDIAEVIVNEGVEMNQDMVNTYHALLISHLRAPFSLLINKLNAYTYTFEAQKNIGNIEQIKAMAVLTYSHTTEVSTHSMIQLPRAKSWNIQMFSDRETALGWLLAEQDNTGPGLNLNQGLINPHP